MTNENRQVYVNGVCYRFIEEFDVNLTLGYENDNWCEWHILREFISNALDSVYGDISKLSIHTEGQTVTISDEGEGYPLVYAKRIGATSKREDTTLIGNFGEGVKMSLLACVRKDIRVRLLSRNWLIEPKSQLIENQSVLVYDIYESEEEVKGTLIVIEENALMYEIINNLSGYFLQFRNNSSLYGDMKYGIYPLDDHRARLYNKGVYVKEINALYSYGICVESLNHDRDLISQTDISQAVRKIWNNVNDIRLIKPLITASTWDYSDRSALTEFVCTITPNDIEAWSAAFTELFGTKALLYTNDFAEREAKALGYKVIACDYRIADILKQAGIRNDTETLSDDYEFIFTDELAPDEAAIINKVHSLACLLNIDAPQNVKVFEEYINHEDIEGIYNNRTGQIYLRKKVLSSGLENTLNVYLHEVNHHISGADDYSREFADNLCRILSNLLLRYSAEAGVKSTVCIKGTEMSLPQQYTNSSSQYANFAAIGNKLYITTNEFSIEVTLPVILASPVCGMRKIITREQLMVLKLPGKLISALTYVGFDCSFDCVVRLVNFSKTAEE